jgi:hypothetical protein
MFGVITSVDQGTHRSVDITFHDTLSQRPVHFKDHFGLTMAVLGKLFKYRYYQVIISFGLAC